MKDFPADDDVEDGDFDDDDDNEAELQEIEDYDPTFVTGGVPWCALQMMRCTPGCSAVSGIMLAAAKCALQTCPAERFRV